MTERRKFLRFNTADVGMEYRICQEKELNGTSCVKDLSREGTRFLISKKLNRGTLINMKFVLPGDPRPVYLTGEVMWTAEIVEQTYPDYMIGIKFRKIDSFDRVRLLDYAYSEWLKSSKAN